MRKNLHNRILRRESKKQYLSIVPKHCSNYIIRSSKASMFHIFLLIFFKQIFINNRKQIQHNNKKQNPPRYCYQLRMIIKIFIDILYCFHFIFVCTDFKTLPLSFHICVYRFKTWLALHAEPKTVQLSRLLFFIFFFIVLYLSP